MALLGSQLPRLSNLLEGDETRGEKAVQFAAWCGLTLFPWQEDVLRQMCKTTPEGKWAAGEAVVIVPRQNGKGEVLLARELAGIYLFGEHNVLHTAHFLDTAVEARDRLWDVIQKNPDLYYWWENDPDTPGVPVLGRTNGKECIDFPNGAKIRFRTRTIKTGRGLSFELVIFDESFDLPNQVHSAIAKTTRAKISAQRIYISSPVNRYEHAHGAILSAKRWAALDGSPDTYFAEWSIDPDQVDMFSEQAWVQSNPSLVDDGPGAQIRDIRSDAQSARNSEVLKEEYLVETLGVGQWVPRDGDTSDFVPVVDLSDWQALENASPDVPRLNENALGLDVDLNAEYCAIVAATKTRSGVHLSLSPRTEFEREGVAADIDRAVENNDPLAIALDPRSAASTIEKAVNDIGVEPLLMTPKVIVRGYMLLRQLLQERAITHDGNPRWLEALRVVEERDVGDYGKGLRRKTGAGCPLVAASFAIAALDDAGLQEVAPVIKPSIPAKPKILRTPDKDTTPASFHF